VPLNFSSIRKYRFLPPISNFDVVRRLVEKEILARRQERKLI
jgi:hypothetical protein